VRDVADRHRGHRTIPVTEVQALVSFTVLVPERIPRDWSVTCSLTERSQRPAHPAAVSLRYHSDDNHQNVSLSQYAAGEQPGQYALMMAAEGEWETVTRGDAEIRVNQPERAGGQAQAFVEHTGTFVFLMSETVGADGLIALAAGLKRPGRQRDLALTSG
jgi:hypothetical protein